jgi:hypothetical protein
MSFSIFDKMNWTFFETKFFNYFIRESFLKDSFLLRQGYKYDKIYFIMDGTFELTTSLNYETIKNFVKYKSKKYPKYINELNIIKSKEPVDKKKLYKFKLSIIDNRDIVGMDDYFIFDDDISFINVKCLSDDAIVFSIEKNLLNNLRRKITEIDNNVKLIIKKRVEIMIQKLMIIFRVIINNPNVSTKKICLSEEFHKRRVKSALVNNNNSQTNHRKIKNIISLSQLNLLNKEENGKNENGEFINDIYRNKERDNSLNNRENKNTEASNSKKSTKTFNFLDNINNEEIGKNSMEKKHVTIKEGNVKVPLRKSNTRHMHNDSFVAPKSTRNIQGQHTLTHSKMTSSHKILPKKRSSQTPEKDKVQLIKNQIKNDFINFSRIEISDDGAGLLINFLKDKNNAKFKEIKFVKSGLSDDGVIALIESFQGLGLKISTLNFSNNGLTDKCGNCVINLLKNNVNGTLKTLYLSNNNFSFPMKEKIKSYAKTVKGSGAVKIFI